MANSRVSRGRRTQKVLAEGWFREHGWPNAESIAASLPGKDITGMPGWAPEVKATTRDGSLTGALKQAKKNATEDETPFVVWRPDGYGEERIGEWVVAISLEDFTRMMVDVEGFGGPPASEVKVTEYDMTLIKDMLTGLFRRVEELERAS